MISVPKDLAHKLLKKSGSADNIAAVSSKNLFWEKFYSVLEVFVFNLEADINLTPNNLQPINSITGIGSRSVQGGKSIFYTNLDEDR